MTLEGKGFFIWQIRNCEGGDVDAIAEQAEKAKLTHVIVKVADNVQSYNIDAKTGKDLVVPLVKALRDRDIQVWGWQYIYGYDPIGEADKAVQRIKQFNLDGFVVNAEGEYKYPDRDRAARHYMLRLRAALPMLPIGLSSYRYPSFHPQLPWNEFLARCDIAMPQVYWMMNHNPGKQLERTVYEYQSLNYVRPIVPTGSAYQYGDWTPTLRDETEFIEKAIELNLRAINFWEWGHTRKYLPHIWKLIRDYNWSFEVGQNIGQAYIDALNSHDPDKVLQLYTENAVHVTSQRTIQGHEAIHKWYVNLFNNILPNAVFSLNNSLGKGMIRYLSWIAQSSAGNVDFGSDTIGLEEDKIAYHYTFFIVT